MSDGNNYNGGIGFAGILTIVFIVLKLVGIINWSWWWVLSPLWIPPGIIMIILAIIGLIYLCLLIYEHYEYKYYSRRK